MAPSIYLRSIVSKQPSLRLGAVLLMLLNCATPLASAEDSALMFAIEPQQSTTESARRWIPVIRCLSEKSGVILRFIAAKDLVGYKTVTSQHRRNSTCPVWSNEFSRHVI